MNFPGRCPAYDFFNVRAGIRHDNFTITGLVPENVFNSHFYQNAYRQGLGWRRVPGTVPAQLRHSPEIHLWRVASRLFLEIQSVVNFHVEQVEVEHVSDFRHDTGPEWQWQLPHACTEGN